ncbi:MAG: hypothetical protein WC373_01715 [Smithella sp.]
MTKLTFNAELHEYRDAKGNVIPSVTQVLESVGLSDFSGVPADVLAVAQERGLVVHKITELYDMEMLDMSSVDPKLKGYLTAYKKFLNDFKILSFMAIEEIVYNLIGDYAGTLDRIAETQKGKILFDIKTGVFSIAHGPQVATYEAAHAGNCKIDTIGTLYLNDDGTYKFKEEHNRKYSFLIFLNALTVHKYKMKGK